MKTGVIGYPIHHSKSPIIHQYWFDKYNIDGGYQPIEIKLEDLEEKIKDLVDQGYTGFNVTVPHKENIFKICDEIDDTAKKIGAVNTVVIKNKKLYGTNTDAFGFIQNIKTFQPVDFKDKKSMVLGAGGASRAVLYGLLEEGVDKILLTNRTREKAEKLKQLSPKKIKIIDWGKKEKFLNETDLLVNTTSLGMTGQKKLEIDLENLNKEALVTDIVYSPLITDLLETAQSRGNEIVTGIGMLLHQARPAFQAWTGVMPEVTKDLEQKVLL